MATVALAQRAIWAAVRRGLSFVSFFVAIWEISARRVSSTFSGPAWATANQIASFQCLSMRSYRFARSKSPKWKQALRQTVDYWKMHVTDVTLDVYKQNLNAGLLQQRHWKVWSALDIFFSKLIKKTSIFSVRKTVHEKKFKLSQLGCSKVFFSKSM